MLARAFQYKEALTRVVVKSLDDPFYDYLWDFYTDFNVNIADSNCYNQQWVSLDNTFNVIGYFGAEIDRSCNSVSSIRIANFCKDKSITFSCDLKEFFIRLFFRYNYSKIDFSVVVGCRNEAIYDKFINRYGGRIVGTFKNHRRLQNGSLVDMKYYEIAKGKFEDKAKVLHPNQLKKCENKNEKR